MIQTAEEDSEGLLEVVTEKYKDKRKNLRKGDVKLMIREERRVLK